MSYIEQWVAVGAIVFAILIAAIGIEKKLLEILGELRLINYKIDNR